MLKRINFRYTPPPTSQSISIVIDWPALNTQLGKSEMSMGVVNRTNAKVNTTNSPLSIPNSVSLGSAFGLAIRFGQMQNCQIFTQAI